MSCKKEKNNDSKEREQVKLKNQKNSDSIRKEISEEISENFKKIHMRKSSCSNRSPIYGEGAFNEDLIDSSLEQGNFYESPVTNFSSSCSLHTLPFSFLIQNNSYTG